MNSIHSCALAGHIEDIAVAKSEQGKKFGIKIINTLTDISEKVGCYKTTLVCADHNVKFYERCGFAKGQNEMVRSSSQFLWNFLTSWGRKCTSTRRTRKRARKKGALRRRSIRRKRNFELASILSVGPSSLWQSLDYGIYYLF
jgi:citrate lyase synthetase